MKEIINKFVKKIQKLKKYYKTRWKLYLYYKNQCIGKRYIDADFAPMGKEYVVKIKHMKHLVGGNNVQMIVTAYKYKYSSEKTREVHIEVIPYEGVEINE